MMNENGLSIFLVVKVRLVLVSLSFLDGILLKIHFKYKLSNVYDKIRREITKIQKNAPVP
jgi:hypothetical protein